LAVGGTHNFVAVPKSGPSSKMIIFTDKVTGDEMFTDACTFKLSEDGSYYIVSAKLKTEKGDNIQLEGANASAEEQAEEYEDGPSKTGLDIVMNHDLQSFGFENKKKFQLHLKEQIQELTKLAKEDPSVDMDKFKANAQNFMSAILKGKTEFKELEFYLGPNGLDSASSCVVIDWNEDGQSAECYIFAEGVNKVKV